MEQSELLQTYENDRVALEEKLKNTFAQISQESGEKQKTIIRSAAREIDELQEILDQMSMEVINIASPARTRMQAKIRMYKSDAEKYKRDLRRAEREAATSSNRRELLGSEDDLIIDVDAQQADQRQRLLSGTERLGDSSRRLEDSHRLALETENIGINILGTLKGQRETILRARDTLGEADSHIDKASRTLKSMIRRMATNKMITAAIILILVVLIVLIIWSKLF